MLSWNPSNPFKLKSRKRRWVALYCDHLKNKFTSTIFGDV